MLFRSADPEGHDTLDAALCAAVFDIVKKSDVASTLTLKSTELRAMGKLLTGRQALHLVYSEYAIDEERGVLYDISHLMLLRYGSDENAPSFLNMWLHTVQGLSEPQSENNLKTLLAEQLKRSEAMKADIAHYERKPKGHPDNSYKFLLDALKRHVQEIKKDQNRKKTLSRFAGNKPNAMIQIGRAHV